MHLCTSRCFTLLLLVFLSFLVVMLFLLLAKSLISIATLTRHCTSSVSMSQSSWILNTRPCCNIKTCLVHYFLNPNNTNLTVDCANRYLLLGSFSSPISLISPVVIYYLVVACHSLTVKPSISGSVLRPGRANTHFSALVLSVLSALSLPNLTRRPQLMPRALGEASKHRSWWEGVPGWHFSSPETVQLPGQSV